MKDTIAFSLSQEEVLVVMAYLKARALMGLDASFAAQLSEEQRRVVLEIAERALLARGLLVPGPDNRMQLVPPVLAVIGACVLPEHSLVVTAQRPLVPIEPYFFHVAREMVVMHSLPISGIHQFIAVKERLAMAQAVLSVLALGDQAALDVAPGQLPQDTLTQARDAAEKDGAGGALAVFQGTSLARPTAEQLATTLANPVANHTLVYITHGEGGESTADGFTLLRGTNGLWLLRPEGADDDPARPVSLASVSAQQVVARFKALINLS